MTVSERLMYLGADAGVWVLLVDVAGLRGSC